MVHKRDLGDHKHDLEMWRRTSRGIEEDLQRVAEAASTRERERLSQDLGVVLRGDATNPFREHAGVDTVRQIPTDAFHEDALVSETWACCGPQGSWTMGGGQRLSARRSICLP